MTNMNDQPMTKEKRQEKIIDIIRSNKYCNKQTVVKELKDEISRATVFDLLRELIKIGAVKTYSENNQKKNARDYKLFVAEDNPLVSVRLELEEFERTYFDLFDKEMSYIESCVQASRKESNTEKLNESSLHLFLVQLLVDVFYFMVDAYLFRLLYEWSHQISDRRVLQQLYSMVFSRIADMQVRISESLNSASIKIWHDVSFTQFMQQRFRSTGSGPLLENSLYIAQRVGKEKEVESIIDSLWNIIDGLQPYVYPEPRRYGWPFHYEKDNWRKLVYLLRKHRKSTSNSKGRSGSSAAI
jgi:hypothetical protein